MPVLVRFHRKLDRSGGKAWPELQNNRPDIGKQWHERTSPRSQDAGGVVGSTGTKQPSMAGLNRIINAGSTFCGAQPVASSGPPAQSSRGWQL